MLCISTDGLPLFNPSVENTFILRTSHTSLSKINSCVLHRQIKHSFVLVIIVYMTEWADFETYII